MTSSTARVPLSSSMAVSYVEGDRFYLSHPSFRRWPRSVGMRLVIVTNVTGRPVGGEEQHPS